MHLEDIKLKIQFNDGNDLEYDRESVSNGVCLETMVNEFFGEWVGGMHDMDKFLVER